MHAHLPLISTREATTMGTFPAARHVVALLAALAWLAPWSGAAQTTPITAAPLPPVASFGRESPGSGNTADRFVSTGAATYAYSLPLPPGRGGVTPSLALVYNSQSQGVPPLGKGWELAIESIERERRPQVDYSARRFVFRSGGASFALVECAAASCPSPWETDEYRPRIEDGSGLRLFFRGGAWFMLDKNGTKRVFGADPANRVGAAAGTSRWPLEREVDVNGNAVLYTYLNNDQLGLRLSRVEYAALVGRDGSVVSPGARWVTFSWPAPTANLVSILMESRTASGATVTTGLVRLTLGSWLNGTRQIASIQRFGSDLTTAEAPTLFEYSKGDARMVVMTAPSALGIFPSRNFPPTFAVGELDGDGRADVIQVGQSGWPVGDLWRGTPRSLSLGGTMALQRAGDFDGDGRTEIASIGAASVTVVRNSGTGSTAEVWPVSSSAAVVSPDGNALIHVADFDGDGASDIAHSWAGRKDWTVWLADPAARRFVQRVWSLGTEVAYAGGDGVVATDFNSDGKADIVRVTRSSGAKVVLSSGRDAPASVQAWINPPAVGQYTAVIPMPGGGVGTLSCGDVKEGCIVNPEPPDPSNPTGCQIEYPWFQTASGCTVSFPGSLPEVVRNEFFPGCKNIPGIAYTKGCWGQAAKGFSNYVADWESPWAATVSVLPEVILGGRFPDPILVARAGARWVPLTGKMAAHDDQPCPAGSLSVAFVAGDFLGTGRDGIAVACSGSQTWSLLAEPVDTAGTNPPAAGLLMSVTSGTGSKVSYRYRPTTAFNAAPGEGAPPANVLPGPLMVVSSVTVDDGLGNLSEWKYTYSGSYFDRADQEFRGFRAVTKTNPDLSTEESTFHTRDGPGEDGDFKGRLASWKRRDNTGTLLATTDLIWNRGAIPKGAYPVHVRLGSRSSVETIGSSTVSSFESREYHPSGDLRLVKTWGDGVPEAIQEFEYQSYPTWDGRPLWRLKRMWLTGKKTAASVGKHRETTYDYYADDVQGYGTLKSKEDWLEGAPANPLTTYTYHPDGRLKSTRGFRGETTLLYDASSAYVERVRPPVTEACQPSVPCHEERFAYDPRFGAVEHSWDENGNRTSRVLDPLGRSSEVTLYKGDPPLVSVTLGDIAAKTKLEYSPPGVVPSWTKQSVLETGQGGTEVYSTSYAYFDGLGRSIQRVAPAEGAYSVIRAGYDNMGRLWWTAGPFLASGTSYPQETPERSPWVQRSFHPDGRLKTITWPRRQYPAGFGPPYTLAAATWTYEGATASVTDPDQPTRTLRSEKRDALGRTIEVTEYTEAGLPRAARYDYDAAGDLLSITDPRGRQIEMVYDTLGRATTIKDPEADKAGGGKGEWSRGYFADGLLEWSRDPNGVTITMAYDALGRPKSKTYSNGEPQVTWAYDDPAVPNGRGRLFSVSRGASLTEKEVVRRVESYDAAGRPTQETSVIRETPYTTRCRFDRGGRLEWLQYPDLYQVQYEYHPGTSLTSVVKGLGTNGVPDGKEYVAFALHDARGQPGVVQHANRRLTTNRTFDPWTGDVVEIEAHRQPASGTVGPADIIHYTGYESTATGDLALLSDYKRGKDLGIPGGALEQRYAYDGQHRLKNESTGIPGFGSPTADLVHVTAADRANALGEVRRGASAYPFTYYDAGNLKVGWDFTDPSAPARRSVTWNGDNLPSAVKLLVGAVERTTAFAYDGEGDRVVKSGPSGTTIYVGPHYEVQGGTPVRWVLAGGARVARLAAGLEHYLHQDRLGSTVAITDATGALQWQGSYSPAGLLREEKYGARVTNYLFTGQEYDPETRLYYYGARYYDPSIGRFLSPDGIVPRLYDPQALNRYAYARNSPVNRVDPSGNSDGPMTTLPGPEGGWPIDVGPPPWLEPQYPGPAGAGGAGGGPRWHPGANGGQPGVQFKPGAATYRFLAGRLSIAGMHIGVEGPFFSWRRAWQQFSGDESVVAPSWGMWHEHDGNVWVIGEDSKLDDRFAMDVAMSGMPMGGGGGLAGGVRAAGSRLVGQEHHAVTRLIHRAMAKYTPRLARYFKPRDARFVSRAKDLASHNGYQSWHRALDREAERWIRANPRADPEDFIEWLRWRYSQPDLRGRFPDGF